MDSKWYRVRFLSEQFSNKLFFICKPDDHKTLWNTHTSQNRLDYYYFVLIWKVGSCAKNLNFAQ